MKKAFTLLELMMAIMILSIMLLLSFICFNAVVSSWTAGREMSDSLSQGDYVMNQIESALRSAYFSMNVEKEFERGFIFKKNGEEADARDVLEWMKLGRAFVGTMKDTDGKTELAETPHRVRLFVRDESSWESKNAEEGFGLFAKAWCNDFRDENETEEEREEAIREYLISPRVIALDCKVLKEPPPENAKEVEWETEWTSSNALPYKVSVTLYLKPAQDDGDPIILTRDIEIPVWKYSQNPGEAGKSTGKGGGKSQGGKSEAGTTGAASGPGSGRRPGGQPGPGGPSGPGPGGGGMMR